MKIETALKYQIEAKRRINDLFTIGIQCRASYKEFLNDFNDIEESLSRCPRWTRDYIRGYFDARLYHILNYCLEYCYFVDGEIVSSQSRSNRSYLNKGFELIDIQESEGGLYWINSDSKFY